jgi:hypothetical protein
MSFSAPVLSACKRGSGIGFISLTLLASVGFLTGCGGMVSDAPTPAVGGTALQGIVHGGQNPVSGATIQLYSAPASAGSTYGAAATAIAGASTSTGSNGSFTLPSYQCPASQNDQVYIVSVGGNPGAGTNPNLALMAALGPCSALTPQTFITINEVTTVASAYALSGFMADYAHVGATSTNYTGLKNAFATVNNLVNTATGTALAVTPYYSVAANGTNTTSATFASVVPQAELYTLANIIASCVNTNGVNGSSSNCSNLFASSATSTTTGGVPGTPDTIQAALNIAKSPGNNVATLFGLASANPPWPTQGLSAAPNDWTIALQFTGGGLGGNSTNHSGSFGLAIDGADNIWVANSLTSTVTELNNLGAPQSPNMINISSGIFNAGGFTNASLSLPAHLAIDTNGNIFVGSHNSDIIEFNNAGVYVNTLSGGGLTKGIAGLAIDGKNNIWADDGSVVGEFNNGGMALSGSGFDTGSVGPSGAIAVDVSNDVWVVNKSNGNLVKLNTGGSVLFASGDQLVNPVASGAVDGSGQFWGMCTTPNPELLLFNTNASLIDTYNSILSVVEPQSISLDGGGHFWVPDQGNSPNWVTEVSGSGSALSPIGTGYGPSSGMVNAGANEVDNSGNLWVVNEGSSNGATESLVTEFVGLATPTVTPLAAAVANNKIGQRP